MTVTCPYCSQQAKLVTGREVYPHRPDLFHKNFYQCSPCDAFVGCHPGTTLALGRLADRELRMWKQRTHTIFDPLWQEHGKTRKQAYAWLAKEMGISDKQCHIGMFDVEQCKAAIAAIGRNF